MSRSAIGVERRAGRACRRPRRRRSASRPRPRCSRARVSCGMERSTSSRTTLPKRRRRSSSSMASSRSSASSSSMARSALRVTRKRWWSSDLHAREERVQVGGDDLLEQDVGARADLPQARQHRRHLDAREAALAGARVAHGDRQRQRQVADVRERVRRIDRQRRQDREDLVQEALAQLELALRSLLVAARCGCLRLGQLGRATPAYRSASARAWSCRTRSRMRVEDLGGRQAVGRRPGVAGGDLLLEARHADLEELVEVAGEDGQEAGPLQQRVALVLRLVEDALVELQPRQLAVDVRQRGGHALPCGAASRRRADGGHGGGLGGAGQASGR